MTPFPPTQFTPTPVAPDPSPAPGGGRRRWMWIVGILVIIGSILAALTLWGASMLRQEAIVESLERFAPGCASTIDVAVAGTYVVYAETTSELDAVRGTCNRTGPVEGTAGDGEDIGVAFTDEAGQDVAFDAEPGDPYDVAGFVGRRVGTVTFPDPGEYVVTVGEPSDRDADVVVAIGRDIDEGTRALTLAAIATLVAGGLLGVGLIVLGVRRRPGAAGPEREPFAPPSVGLGEVSLPPVVPPPVSPPLVLPPPAPPAGTSPWGRP